MSYILVCHGVAGVAMPLSPDQERSFESKYVQWYNPEAQDGYGVVCFTEDPVEAMRFETIEDAHTAIFKVPETRPVRDDGVTNRPLTAFHLEIRPLPN